MRAAAVLVLISAWQLQLVFAQTSTCSVSITGTPAGGVQAATIACTGPIVQMSGAAALQPFSAKFTQGAPLRPRRARMLETTATNSMLMAACAVLPAPCLPR